MIVTLLKLQWMTFVGRIRRAIRLLKQPKYLVGFVVGTAWLMSWAVRPFLNSDVSMEFVRIADSSSLSAQAIPTIHLIASIGFMVILLMPWLSPFGKLGLGFREAELTMLLQAPLTRRQIIGYGLLKSGIASVLTALVLTVLFGFGGPVERFRMWLGLLLVFVFWDLNAKWRGMFLLRQREVSPGLAWTRRIAITLGVFAYLAVTVTMMVRFQVSMFSRLRGADFQEVADNFSAVAEDIASTPLPELLEWLIKPGWVLTAPLFSSTWMQFAIAVVPLAVVIVIQRELVLRNPAHFEEAELEHAVAEENKKSPTRRFKKISGRARARSSFALTSLGRPELAIVWKNLTQATRMPLSYILLFGPMAAILIAAIPVALQTAEIPYYVMLILGMVGMLFPSIMVGMTWSNDLRSEFGHIDILRTWPISAERFVLAQIASPAVLSFVISTVSASAVLIAFIGSRVLQMRTGVRSNLQFFSDGAFGIGPTLGLILLLLGLLPLSAGAAFASSAIQNLAVLFVPAWMAESGHEARGIAAFGRRLVFGIGVFFGFALALIPSVLLVGAAAFLQHLAGIPWTAWMFPIWGLLAAVPLAAEGWLVVQLAGRLWRNLDPSEEVLEIGN